MKKYVLEEKTSKGFVPNYELCFNTKKEAGQYLDAYNANFKDGVRLGTIVIVQR